MHLFRAAVDDAAELTRLDLRRDVGDDFSGEDFEYSSESAHEPSDTRGF